MKVILYLLLVIITYIPLNAQTLKLRLDVGGDLGFSSYGKGLVTQFYEKPGPSPYYSLIKETTNSFDLGPKIGLMVDFSIKNRFHIESGFLYNENVMISLRSSRWDGIPIPGSEYLFMGSPGIWMETGPPLFKLPLHLSYDLRKLNTDKRINIIPALMFGVNFIWNQDGSDLIIENDPAFTVVRPENLYPDSFVIERITWHSGKKRSDISAVLGTQVRFFWKKYEMFSLKVFYEQGFNNWTIFEYEMWRDHKYFNQMVYSKGSALHFKVSVPITIKKFGVKKKA